MDSTNKHTPASRRGPSLEQVLRRGDVWRGHSRAFLPRNVISSGFENCDKALLNGGWPTGSLLECCIHNASHSAYGGEWQVFTPAIVELCQKHHDSYVVLLNPPATPFAPALIQANIPLNQLLVVDCKNKQDLIACLVEFTRSNHCLLLLAWQGAYTFNYTELRKCQLACAEGSALYVLFRPENTRQQSSPAPLRLALTLAATQLQLGIFKQRGMFGTRKVAIELPVCWQYSTETRPGSSAKNKIHHIERRP